MVRCISDYFEPKQQVNTAHSARHYLVAGHVVTYAIIAIVRVLRCLGASPHVDVHNQDRMAWLTVEPATLSTLVRNARESIRSRCPLYGW